MLYFICYSTPRLRTIVWDTFGRIILYRALQLDQIFAYVMTAFCSPYLKKKFFRQTFTPGILFRVHVIHLVQCNSYLKFVTIHTKYHTFVSNRCCSESEVISNSGSLKQTQNKTAQSYIIPCEPNTLIQMKRSLLEEKWNNSGGSIDKDRLFRNTKRTCYNSKKWNKIKIAQPKKTL